MSSVNELSQEPLVVRQRRPADDRPRPLVVGIDDLTDNKSVILTERQREISTSNNRLSETEDLAGDLGAVSRLTERRDQHLAGFGCCCGTGNGRKAVKGTGHQVVAGQRLRLVPGAANDRVGVVNEGKPIEDDNLPVTILGQDTRRTRTGELKAIVGPGSNAQAKLAPLRCLFSSIGNNRNGCGRLQNVGNGEQPVRNTAVAVPCIVGWEEVAVTEPSLAGC